MKRVADEEILIADAKLAFNAQALDTVQIAGERNRVNRNAGQDDIGGTERGVSASNLAADQQGDLAAMAASIPGVQFVPGADGDPSGFSVLGLTSDQNATTLNGLNTGPRTSRAMRLFPARSSPRHTTSRVAASAAGSSTSAVAPGRTSSSARRA